MKKIFCAVVIALTGGCAHMNPTNIPHFDAWSPDGTVDRKPIKADEFAEGFNKHGGAIFVFKEGDIIDLNVKLNGDILESIDGHRVKAKRKLYWYGGKGGSMVSLDGKNFYPIRKLFPTGSFSVFLDDQNRTNKLDIEAVTRLPSQ
ncbi:MAG TPA: hypothetical protein VI895_00310 [Bdellovibrionota bacterium]|nr:hypothetical protein [Bdellovibrionota bacterium]